MKIGYKNILLTGEPGCGKSTLLKNLISLVDQKSGIITEQVLISGERVGFNVIDSHGTIYPLASKTIESDLLFANKYRIQTDGLSKLIDTFSYSVGDLLYLDEIAPMQLYTPGFEGFTTGLLDSTNVLIGVIKLDNLNYHYIKEVKSRSDTIVINLSDPHFNHEFLTKLIKKIIKSQNYIKEVDRFQKISENNRLMNSASSTRNLIKEGGILKCDCQFYQDYGICSHSIALRQIISSLL